MAYAVQLYFDAELEAALIRTRTALTKAGVTPTLERLGDRPHVSLAVLNDVRVPHCISMLERFSKTWRPFEASFAAFGAFATNQNVIYLSPTPSELLLTMHRVMYQELVDAGAQLHEHYLPGSWVPHATIAFEIRYQEVAVALSWLQANFKPLAGKFSSIGLIEFRPIKELATYAFTDENAL